VHLEEPAQCGPPELSPLLVPAAAPDHRTLRYTQFTELGLLGASPSVHEEDDILRPDAVLAKIELKKDTMLPVGCHATFHDTRNLRISTVRSPLSRPAQKTEV